MELLANIVSPLALVVVGMGGSPIIGIMVEIAVIWLFYWLLTLIPVIPSTGKTILFVAAILLSILSLAQLLGGV